MKSKTGAKGIIWPEIIAQSSLKSGWNTNMKACIFGSFNFTQHRLITVMALSFATPWKYLILLHAVHHYCKHTCTRWSNKHRWVLCVFYLSLSFFITIFIIIMWHPLKARFKYLYLLKARADSGSNEQCGLAAYFLDVIALKNFCLQVISLNCCCCALCEN